MPRGIYPRKPRNERASARSEPTEPAIKRASNTATARKPRTEGTVVDAEVRSVPMSEAYYWWLTVTADAMGKSRTETLDMILAEHIKRERKG